MIVCMMNGSLEIVFVSRVCVLTGNYTMEDYVMTRHQPPLLASDFRNQIMVGYDGRRYDSVANSHGRYYWRCVDKTSCCRGLYDESLPRKLEAMNEDVDAFVHLLESDSSLSFSSFSRSWWMRKPLTFLKEIAMYHGWREIDFLPKAMKMNYIDYFMSYPSSAEAFGDQLFLKKYFVSRRQITDAYLSRLTLEQLTRVIAWFRLDVTADYKKAIIGYIQSGLNLK